MAVVVEGDTSLFLLEEKMVVVVGVVKVVTIVVA